MFTQPEIGTLQIQGELRESQTQTHVPKKRLEVLLLDLWCFIPYYMAALAKALPGQNIDARLLSATYRFEPQYFRKNAISNNPGLIDLVSRAHIRSARLQQWLKAIEYCCNLLILAFKFLFSRPDILHVQYLALLSRGVPIELPLLREAKLLGIKLVCTVHNILPHDTGEKHKAAFQRLYRMADLIICHNQATKQQLIREFGILDKIEVIPHGLLQQAEAPLTRAQSRVQLQLPIDPCVVLWQGVILPYKGLDFLLDALSKLRFDVMLVIAGSGKENILEALKGKVSQLNPSQRDRVRLDLGYIPPEELPFYYEAADILVYPYKQITSSGALLTGLGYGKAIIATRLPSFEEMLCHERDALLVEYGNAAELAQAINRLARDQNLRARLGSQAKLLAETKYSWKQIAAKTRECYDMLMI